MTDFRGTRFEKAPRFEGCTLHQHTIFSKDTKFKDTKSDGAAQAYRTLKLAMENHRARQEEAMFYALEQKRLRAAENRDMSLWEATLSWLYEKAANYGRSSQRPFWLLVALTVLFWGIYAIVASPGIGPDRALDLGLIWESAGFSVQQVVLPFWAWRLGAPPDWWPHGWLALRVIAGFQSVFSVILLALVILAIRWRFRRG